MKAGRCPGSLSHSPLFWRWHWYPWAAPSSLCPPRRSYPRLRLGSRSITMALPSPAISIYPHCPEHRSRQHSHFSTAPSPTPPLRELHLQRMPSSGEAPLAMPASRGPHSWAGRTLPIPLSARPASQAAPSISRRSSVERCLRTI